MLFEPAFGSFPGMDSYETKACISFGSQVDFEARFILADLWNSEERHKHETPLSSETPGKPMLSRECLVTKDVFRTIVSIFVSLLVSPFFFPLRISRVIVQFVAGS